MAFALVEKQAQWRAFDLSRHRRRQRLDGLRAQRAGTLGDVTLPAGLEVYEIGTDYALGRWQDATEVDYIHQHALACTA